MRLLQELRPTAQVWENSCGRVDKPTLPALCTHFSLFLCWLFKCGWMDLQSGDKGSRDVYLVCV